MASSDNDINTIASKKPRINDVTKWLTEEDEDNDISYNVSARWRELGIALGLRDGTLDEIEDTRGNTARLRRVLSHWIEHSKTCSWETLIEALKGGIVQKRITADHVMKRLAEDEIFERYTNYKD